MSPGFSSFVDRLVYSGMALLFTSLGIYAGIYKRTLSRTGSGVELGEWSWFVGGGLIAVGAVSLVVTWWPSSKPPA